MSQINCAALFMSQEALRLALDKETSPSSKQEVQDELVAFELPRMPYYPADIQEFSETVDEHFQESSAIQKVAS